MAKHPNVAAHADDDASLHRQSEGPLRGLHGRGWRRLARYIAAKIGRGAFAGRQGREIGDAPLGHQLERGFAAAIAVLDGVRPRQDRAAHALVAGGMDGHGATARMGHLDHGLQLFQGESRPRGAVGPDAIVGVDLDPVGPRGGLLAHGPHRLVDPADLFRALGDFSLGMEVATRRTIGAGGHDGAGGDEQAWAGNQPVGDGALQRHVRHPRALGAQVAQGGEAGIQRRPGLHRGADHPVVGSLLQHLIVP